jgi:hypothetical protein
VTSPEASNRCHAEKRKFSLSYLGNSSVKRPVRLFRHQAPYARQGARFSAQVSRPSGGRIAQFVKKPFTIQ